MADLSNLLGAVYGDSSESERDPDGPPVPVERAADERTPAVPDWADDDHLDAAFAEWKPGPSPDADAAERDMVADATDIDDDEPVVVKPLADDLAAALSEALVAADAPARDAFTSGYDTDEDEDLDDDLDDDVTDVGELPAVLDRPFEHRRVAAAELSATAGPLPVAPPPPADHIDDDDDQVEHHAEPVTVNLTAPAEAPAVGRAWERADDDILPTGRGRKFFSLSLRRG